MRKYLPAVIAAFCLFTASAHAEQPMEAVPYAIEAGTGVLCDSRAQIERVAALGAKASSVQTINASEPKACTYAEVQFIRGASYGQVRLSRHTFEVVEVLVLGFKSEGEWRQLSPMVQWTLFPIREETA
jgi:hypothetical protein